MGSDKPSLPVVFRPFLIGLAASSGLLAILILLAIAANSFYVDKLNPAASPLLKELRADACSGTASPQELDKFRDMDFLSKKSFIRALLLSRKLPLLALASFAIFFLSIHAIFLGKAPIPTLPDPSEPLGKSSDKNKALYPILALAGIGLVFSIFLLLRADSGAVSLDSEPGAGTQVEKNSPGNSLLSAPTNTTASEAVHSQDANIKGSSGAWPFFRGPSGNNIASKDSFPLSWDVQSGKNIAWKSQIPKKGNSSPLVWDDKIFFTGADNESREVFCFSISDGSLLWRREIEIDGKTAENLNIFDDTGYAAPSMALSPDRAVAIFANGDIACLDHSGNIFWKKYLGSATNMYGYASSPIISDNKILIQFDNEKDPSLIALALDSGDELWKVKRAVIPSWASPSILAGGEVDGRIAVNGNPFVAIYELKDGKEISKFECSFNDLAISPAFNEKLILIPEGGDKLSCFTSDKLEPLWHISEDLPDVATPLLSEFRTYLAAPSGIVSCIDLNGGAKLWSHEFGTGFYSSPILAGGRVYLCDRDGKTHVFEDSAEFKLLASSDLGEPVVSIPAFVPSKIIIRGSEHLFCIFFQAADAQRSE